MQLYQEGFIGKDQPWCLASFTKILDAENRYKGETMKLYCSWLGTDYLAAALCGLDHLPIECHRKPMRSNSVFQFHGFHNRKYIWSVTIGCMISNFLS